MTMAAADSREILLVVLVDEAICRTIAPVTDLSFYAVWMLNYAVYYMYMGAYLYFFNVFQG